MRVRSAALLVFIVCLLPMTAEAEITSISPESILVGTTGGSLTVQGSGLVGTASTFVVFDGPAGQFFVAPTISGSTLVAPIPASVANSAGPYVIEVAVTNTGGEQHFVGFAIFNVLETPVDGPPQINASEIVVAEATSTRGAEVNYVVTAQSPLGTPVPVTCTPPSGSHFAIGTTNVSCSATNTFGTTFAAFIVVVADTTNPVVTVPADIVSTSPVVTFSASAEDNIDGTLPVTCSPSSGSTFSPGVTLVTCSATDSSANVGSASFNVILEGGEPVLTVPADIEVDSPDGQPVVVPYTVSATNDATINCLPAGFTFGPGVTTITCTATNLTGSDTKAFTITVNDLTAPTTPVLTVPPTITAEATSAAGAVVTFTVTATNEGVVLCSPASGSTFPLGFTTVNCTATNDSGSDADSFDINVVDSTAPSFTPPADITAEATGANGAVVVFAAFGSDLVDGVIQAQCTPASGSVFAIGTTTVECTVTDAADNTSTGAFQVTVQDTTPPELSLPADITVEATSASGAVVTYSASATDIVDGSVSVQCVPGSGSTFAVGTTTVSCSATDAHLNTANGSFDVTVTDSTPPQILSVDANPGVLWPPNHQMVNVTVTVVAVDAIDPAPVSQIISVTSNQPINGTGDGDTSPDWVITGPLTVQLRSERSNGKDRIYTITIETTDASGNSTTATDTVVVTNTKRRAV
jgi:hypothetical protein